jgi:hypothetical protein
MLRMSLCQANGLTGSAAKEEQLCPAYLGASDRYDINDIRRVQREYTLNTLIADHTANGEHLIDAAAFTGDYNAGKHLHTGFIAFNDLAMHFYSVAYLEVRHFFL